MAALSTTLALVGLAAAGAWAAKPSGKGRTVGVSTRSRGDAPITGQAISRADYAAQQAALPPLTAPQPPPSATVAASAATLSAQGARDKARKRAAASGSVLSGAYTGKTGPRAVLQPKMLIGS
jgi:hypothetical protein